MCAAELHLFGDFSAILVLQPRQQNAAGQEKQRLSRGGELAAVLRASGPDFDVDAFVSDCDWNIAKVFRRGEALLPKMRLDGRKRDASGLNVVVSEAGFHEF